MKIEDLSILDEKFQAAKNKIVGLNRERHGIGTLSEKTVHAVLKNLYEPDEDCHEVPIEKFVADIYTNNEIIEIQTRSFNKMREKLSCFLQQYPVTVIYPIPYQKWLIWIDEETGEFSEPRKSPVKGTEYTAFIELYKIKMFLKHENIHFRLLLLDMEEYRLLNGWSKDKKKGSHRFDRIPLHLIREVSIECKEDYMQFVPAELEGGFTVKDFAKTAHIKASLAGVTLNILHEVGTVEKVGKKGNAWIYNVSEEEV